MSKSRLTVMAILLGGFGIAAGFFYGRFLEWRVPQGIENHERIAADVMRMVIRAEVEFLSVSKGRYSKSLQELVAADLIPASYADVFSGYRLYYESGDEGTYELRAEPVLNKEQYKHFFSTENALLRYETGKRANLESPVFRD